VIAPGGGVYAGIMRYPDAALIDAFLAQTGLTLQPQPP